MRVDTWRFVVPWLATEGYVEIHTRGLKDAWIGF